MRILLLALAASAALLAATEFPEAEISNGTVTARLYLPDAQNGYYRGTRFDWSGQIASLRVGGREYFGQWFDKYDPKIHDAIMGPVEEFLTDDTSPGYQEAPVGGNFVRIGVGVLRKSEDRAYERFRTYRHRRPRALDGPAGKRSHRVCPRAEKRFGLRLPIYEDDPAGRREAGDAYRAHSEEHR